VDSVRGVSIQIDPIFRELANWHACEGQHQALSEKAGFDTDEGAGGGATLHHLAERILTSKPLDLWGV
jgi:hypothetical protein